MNAFLKALESGIILGDGALGSELIRAGLQPGEVPELWNIEQPERVRAVHAAYFEAGSRLVLTNTFGGNPIKLAAAGIPERLEDVNAAAFELVRSAAPDNGFVGGDMGPTGEFLEPLGTRTEIEFIEAFAGQAEVLARAGVDVMVLETVADLSELLAAIKGVRQACDLPVIASMTFEKDQSGDDYHTMMGLDIPTYIAAVEQAGVDVVGTNCGKGVHETAEVVARFQQHTDKPVLAFPNAGAPKVVDGRTVYDQSPEVMAPYFQQMIDSGVNIIGGCCGTTPAHIALLADLLKT